MWFTVCELVPKLLLGYYETKLREQKFGAHCPAALLKNKISLS